MAETKRQRDSRYNVTRLAAGSTVHAFAGTVGTKVVLFCTGRAMQDMVGTSERVTCKACIAAGAAGGMGAYDRGI